MSKRVLISINGYCPTQDDDYEIDIAYVETPTLGKSVSEYRRGSFYCDYSDEHNCRLTEECPIYLSASRVRAI